MRRIDSSRTSSEIPSLALLRTADAQAEAAQRDAVNEEPLVSVIIPVRDGASVLGDCLEAVFRSEYRNYEVIVVDDASSDASALVAGSFPCRLVSLKKPAGPARARNAGVAEAKGEIIFFTDCDVVILPNTLERAVGGLRPGTDTAAMGSYTRETGKTNFVSRYKNYLHHYTHQDSKGEVSSFFTACGVIRKEAFEAIGGFDESITGNALEDVELGYRLWRSGAKIFLHDDLQVTHQKHYSLISLLRSDLFERAIPYVRLMFKHRIFKRELSTKPHHVGSVALMSLLPVLVAAGLLTGQYLATALAVLVVAALLLALNFSFYVFVRRNAGTGFMLRSILMHWWGYWYSGIGAVLGLLCSLSDYWRSPPPKKKKRFINGSSPVAETTSKRINL